MTSITWIGHAGFIIEEEEKNNILYIDTWIGNPKAPEYFQSLKDAMNKFKPNYVLVTHGHFDHSSSAPDICKESGAKLISIHEIGEWAKGQGVNEGQVVGMNKGGTVEFDSFKVTMVNADHSSGCPGDHNGGASAGFVIQFNNGTNIYHAGDTNVFLDMKVLSELYQPQLALLPIGGWYTMAEREAAYAIDNLLSTVKTVIPMHFGTFPILKGTPEKLKSLITRKDVKVEELEIGKTYKVNDLL